MDADEPRNVPAPRPDRLPLIFLAAMLLVLPLAAGLGAYLLATRIHVHPAAQAVATTAAAPVAPRPAPRLVTYAGLTRVQASTLATSDFEKLLKSSGAQLPPGAAMEPGGSELSRTRCLRAGHWQPYWRVGFVGGSPIFESKREGILFCNRNRRVIEVTAPIRH